MVSLENNPLSLLRSNILSAWYRLPNGNIADLVPRCSVAFNVDRARFNQIANRSAIMSSVMLAPLCLDRKVFLTGTSSVFGSYTTSPIVLPSLRLAKVGSI